MFNVRCSTFDVRILRATGLHLTATANHPGLLIVLCGPSAVGKSTISNELKEKHNIEYTVSVTTRDKRPGDEKAKIYEYVTRDEFFRRLDRDAFLEYANVHGE